jgi:hypothetical protein
LISRGLDEEDGHECARSTVKLFLSTVSSKFGPDRALLKAVLIGPRVDVEEHRGASVISGIPDGRLAATSGDDSRVRF